MVWFLCYSNSEQLYITGNIFDWQVDIPMEYVNGVFEVELDIPPYTYFEYKYKNPEWEPGANREVDILEDTPIVDYFRGEENKEPQVIENKEPAIEHKEPEVIENKEPEVIEHPYNAENIPTYNIKNQLQERILRLQQLYNSSSFHYEPEGPSYYETEGPIYYTPEKTRHTTGPQVVSGYTRKDGTKVGAYMKNNKVEVGGYYRGDTYIEGYTRRKTTKQPVSGYTKKNGTKVKGYSRKKN